MPKVTLFGLMILGTTGLWLGACHTRKSEASAPQSEGTSRRINLQLYRLGGIAAPGYEDLVQNHHAYLQTFVDLLATQCQITEVFSIPPIKTVDVKQGTSDFKDVQSRGSRDGLDGQAKKFPFEFFQLDLFRLLKQNPKEFSRPHGPEISIIMTEGLEGNCGFALPEIQFAKSRQKGSDRSVIQDLQNRLLIDGSPNAGQDCRNRSRILSHELAHILVQDDPPHLCVGATGKKIPCPKENLLASLVWVPTPRVPRPGTVRPYLGEGGEPCAMRQIPAQGTKLTEDQCEAARRTVKTMWTR